MLFASYELYCKAKKVKQSGKTLPSTLLSLQNWLSKRYKVGVVYIGYEKKEDRPHIDIVLETEEDYYKIYKDYFTLKPNVKRNVTRQLSKLAATSDDSDKYQVKNLTMSFYNFSNGAMHEAVKLFYQNDKNDLLTELTPYNVWDIESATSHRMVFFYLTNEDIQSEANIHIKQRCYELVKQYDVFDYFTPDNFDLKFDSKQNLDENFKGNTFYYFR